MHPDYSDAWRDYDFHKKSLGQDPDIFDCRTSWELRYIIRILQPKYPHLGEETIKQAISYCCLSLQPPRRREDLFSALQDYLERK